MRLQREWKPCPRSLASTGIRLQWVWTPSSTACVASGGNRLTICSIEPLSATRTRVQTCRWSRQWLGLLRPFASSFEQPVAVTLPLVAECCRSRHRLVPPNNTQTVQCVPQPCTPETCPGCTSGTGSTRCINNRRISAFCSRPLHSEWNVFPSEFHATSLLRHQGNMFPPYTFRW